MTIGGEPATGAGRMPVEDPALGAPFAEAPAGTTADLDRAVAAAVAAFPGWAGTDPDRRRELLLRCGAAVRAAVAELAGLLTAEQGKPLADAKAEVRLAADWFRHTAGLDLAAERVVDQPARRADLLRVPVGPVGAITPTNFPIILAVTKLAPALLAGNPVVLKPAPATPLSTLRMGQLLAEVLPAGVLNTVSGGPELGPAVVDHPQLRMISFTGSVPVGRAIAVRAAGSFKRVVLELGGNDACIVLPGAETGRIAPELFRLAMVNAGQFCAAIKRVYVPASQQAELVEGLAAAAGAAVVGDGRDPGTRLGPLVSGDGLARVHRLVTGAVAAGGRAVTGGEPLARPGHFYPPTVVTELPPGTGLEDDEQFGPVIPVLAYPDGDLAQAVARANGTGFGLGGSVWGDPVAAAPVAAALECGTAWINTHGELRPDLPFGGVGQSGVGVEYGYWGLLEYTRIKVVHARGRQPAPVPG